MPVDQWDGDLRGAVDDTLQSILKFNAHCRANNIGFSVVYTPLGVDLDPNESKKGKEKLGLKPGTVFVSSGIETYLAKRLADEKIEFLNLKPVLIAAKKRNCPACEDYLYYSNDGHWTENAHRAIADFFLDHFK
jgi:hypothetical protein